MKLALLALICIATLTAAAPAVLSQNLDVSRDKNGLQTVGDYTVYNNLWGQDRGSGSQCTGIDSVEGNAVKWQTKWSWSGSIVEVKSFANAVFKTTPVPLSSIKSLKTSWGWSYTGQELDANVAYDMFTSSTASGSSEFEVMVWLSSIGPKAVPIGGMQPRGLELEAVSWRKWEHECVQLRC